MNDPNSLPAARVSAATQLLDRGHGKPAARSDVNLSRDINLDKLSDAELMAMLESLRRSDDPEVEENPPQLN